MKTLNKIVELVKSNDIDGLYDYLENICSHYELLKINEWMSMAKKPTQINKNLPVPRIEARWREEIVIDSFLNKKIKNVVIDLCLVSSFMDEDRYNVISATKTTNIEGRDDLYIPWRMEGDAFSLMEQLSLPFFVSYKEKYKEVKKDLK